MPISITMQGALVNEICDVEYGPALEQLNMSAAKGVTFVTLEDMDGMHVMFNLPNILVVKEIEDA